MLLTWALLQLPISHAKAAGREAKRKSLSRGTTAGATQTASARAGGTLLASGLTLALLAGCGATNVDTPVIGSPSAAPSSGPPTTPGRPGQLRAQWNLSGIDLPGDWPDIALPKDTQVASAYAVGSPPRRTWTASFIGESGTANELAKPIIKQLTKDGYTPVSAYTATADADAGLFGFSGEQYSVYLMLGEVDGRPNLLMTIRQQGSQEGAGSLSPSETSPNPQSGNTSPSSSAHSLATKQPSTQTVSGSPAAPVTKTPSNAAATMQAP